MKIDKNKLFLKYSIYIVLVVLVIVFSIISPSFRTASNVGVFFKQIPTVGIMTLALTMILTTGCCDLSLGSILAFCGTSAAYLSIQGLNPVLVVIITILIGCFWGALNGILISQFNLEPFILTMGTSYLIRGIILFVTNGIYVTGLPEWFYAVSNTPVIGKLFYTNTLMFVILIGVFAFLMKNTRFGRYCYAIGSSKESARLSGIDVNKHIVKVFMLEGAMAAIAGIQLMSTLNVGAPAEANGTDLFALAGAIIGGVKFGGGVGTIGGAIVGIFTIEVFKNGLATMGMNSFLQQAVTGAIITLAIIIDYFRTKKAVVLQKS